MIRINGQVYEKEYFPDGTLRLTGTNQQALIHINESEKVIIEWNFQENEEMMILYFLVNHYRECYGTKEIFLVMPYIPNARMDRTKSKDEVFTLKYFAGFINDLRFDKVYVIDPHSYVSQALFHRMECLDIMKLIEPLAIKRLKSECDMLFFPDEGSFKRYHGNLKFATAFGSKQRDWKSGQIQELTIHGVQDLKGANVLIIDDICSFGGTFYHSAKKLKELGVDKIWLFVTHCEKNILKGELLKGDLIDQVYTTNSIFQMEHEKISILDYHDLLPKELYN